MWNRSPEFFIRSVSALGLVDFRTRRSVQKKKYINVKRENILVFS